MARRAEADDDNHHPHQAPAMIDRGYGLVMSRSANLNVSTTIDDLLKMMDAGGDAGSLGAGGAGSPPQTINHDPATEERG